MLLSSRCGRLFSSLTKTGALLILTLVPLCLVGYGSLSAGAGARYFFPHPGSLRPRISFWVKVFGKYSWRDFLIHDRDEVWKVYEVLHVPGSGPPGTEEIAHAEKYLDDKYRRILNWLARGKDPINADQRRVARLFGNAPRGVYAVMETFIIRA